MKFVVEINVCLQVSLLWETCLDAPKNSKLYKILRHIESSAYAWNIKYR